MVWPLEELLRTMVGSKMLRFNSSTFQNHVINLTDGELEGI